MHLSEMKTHFKCFVYAFIIFLSFSACGDKDRDNRRVIAVSIEPQREILEHIVGDKFKIVTIMSGGDNPETFEPSPMRRVDIENSEAYFTVGLLPFENSLKKSSADKNKFVDTSEGINLIYGTHSHESIKDDKRHVHTHTMADPHIWTSVKNAKIMAMNMTEKMTDIDPANAPTYRDNLARYCTYLDSIDTAFAHKLSKSVKKGFLVWHPSLSYFAKDYNLEQISVSSDTKEASVSSLTDVIKKAKTDSINVLFYQQEFDNRQAEMIGKSIDARLITIRPSAYDWVNELSVIVDGLTKE